MNKKRIKIILIVALVILFKLILYYFLDVILINQYNKGNYNLTLAKSLKIINYPESYVANYNIGNIYYKKNKYSDAINYYNNALNNKAPLKKECKIRINMSLSMIKLIKLDESDEISVREAINSLKEARAVIVTKNCANEEGTGIDDRAEELKRQIDEEIKRLSSNSSGSDEDDNKDEEEQNQNNDNNDKDNERKKEQVKESQKKGSEERNAGEIMQKGKKNNYDAPRGKNW